jgi:hypothetical protein
MRGGLFVIQLMRPNQPGESERYIRNVTLRRLRYTGAGRLLDITTMGVDVPVIDGLTLEDISFRGSLTPSRIHGLAASPIRSLTLRRLQLESDTPADYFLSLRHAETVHFSGLQFRLAVPVLFRLFETRNAALSSISTSPVDALAAVSGPGSRAIRLDGAPPAAARLPLTADSSVPAGALVPSSSPLVTALDLPRSPRANQPLEAALHLRNPGPAGAARLPLLINGQESAAAWTWLPAGASSTLRLSGRPLYRPGRYRASAGAITRTLRLPKSPADLALSEPCQIDGPRVSVPVRNLGGSSGSLTVVLQSPGREPLHHLATADPGQQTTVSFHPTPAFRSFLLPGFPEWPYSTFRNVPARFLLYRDRIAIEAGGAPTRWADYAAVYLPAITGDFDAQVRLLSAFEETGEYAAAGLLVRNRLDDPASPGLLMHFRVPKYGGYKIALWDADGDGIPDTRSDGGQTAPPVWYRIEKRGRRFRFLSSTDGLHWRPNGAPGRQEVTLDYAAETQDVGFFANAWNAHGRLSRAEFSNFSVRPVASPPTSAARGLRSHSR